MYGVFFDIVPLLLMLILHYKSFKVRESKKQDEAVLKTEEILQFSLAEDSEFSDSVLLNPYGARPYNSDLFQAYLERNEKKTKKLN